MTDPWRKWRRVFVAATMIETSRLTAAQRGAYERLCDDYWCNGPPPNEDIVLARIVMMHIGDWRRMKEPVLALFRIEAAKLRHARLDQDLGDAEARYLKAQRAAQAKHAPGKRQAQPQAEPEQVVEQTTSRARAEPEQSPSMCSDPATSALAVRSVPSEQGPPLPPLQGGEQTDALPPKRRRARPRTGAPDALLISEGMRAWFRRKYGTACEPALEAQTEAMLDYHRSRGTLLADWEAGWRNWITNWTTDFGKRAPPGNGRPAGAATPPRSTVFDGVPTIRGEDLP
ncbi:MAG: DUF1376 domain-containing protein [Betaproteobacteria bacterium]|nr:DUF1376 domain-containing protein [Betaproteobacteria bacterium]